MPFLRRLDTVASSHELRSSKTLIGSGLATCDIVVPDALELHALLNLTGDKSSGKLVPFSEAGKCFVNDRVVPKDGTVVANGDRVAFGSLSNAFVFQLSPNHSATVSNLSADSARNDVLRGKKSFRMALDALRGDRPTTSVVASMQKNRNATNASKDQLRNFLLEASTDSLLSDYVDRKLKKVANSRSSCNQSETLSLRQSTDERNAAQVEKLRLSQRIREVNDVLNGDMDFQASYLSPTAKRKTNRLSINESVQENSIDSEDEEDELPTMMEKPSISTSRPFSASVSIQTEHSEQETPLSPLGQEDETTMQSIVQDESNRGYQINNSIQPLDSPSISSSTSKVPVNPGNVHARVLSTQQEKKGSVRTALHEKLINQAIRRKQREIVGQMFVRWGRGLRIQRQNREHKALQLQTLNSKLGKLRRNRIFDRWREFAGSRSQVVVCRLEAFQQRCETRLIRKCWIALRLHHSLAKQRPKVLRGLLIRKAAVTRLAAFRRWGQFVQQCADRDHLKEQQSFERQILDNHYDRIAERHYYKTRVQRLHTKIFNRWRQLAHQTRKRRRMLRKLLVHGEVKLVQRAWRKWTETAIVLRHHLKMTQQNELQIKQTTEHLSSEHSQAQSSLRENHAQQVQALMTKIEERDRKLQQVKNQQRAEGLKKAAAKAQWEQDINGFFQSMIFKCDEQIADASNHLEELLQSAEEDVLSARFGAAQFLVDFMLQQKITNANEVIRLQEAQLSTLSSGKALQSPLHDAPSLEFCLAKLSPNSQFLYDMIQQRITRLEQLHLSLAKLAAVSDTSDDSLDPERLRHSRFLSSSIEQRQQQHLLVLMQLCQRL